MNEDQQAALLSAARHAIEAGLAHGRPPMERESAPAGLQAPGAAFVTLTLDGQLRGCIGSLEPIQPLIDDVARNAYAAAFRDPRFPPLSLDEWPQTRISLSVLGPREALPRCDRDQLLALLRPGVDGLVLVAEDGRRATFLPSVWAQLPTPPEFLDHLLAKAGLPADTDLATLQVWRYQTTTVGEPGQS